MKTRFAAPRLLCLALLTTLLLGPGFVFPSLWADERPALSQYQKDKMRYKGKTFAECEKALLHEIDPRERLENLKPMAIFARHGMEKEVITTILWLMREHDYGFVNLDEEAEVTATEGALRTEEEKDEDAVFDECEKIVKKIGPAAAIPMLREWLSSENRGACFFALMVLSEDFGLAAREAIPDVLKLTRNEDHRIVADAYLALSLIEENDAKLLECILHGLQHKRGEVRAAVLDVITATESKIAGCVASEILKALGDDDARVCAAAARAAIQAGLGPKAVPAMIRLIQRDNAEAQDAAYLFLRLLGPAAKDAVPALIDILKEAPNSTKTRQFMVVYRQKSDVPAPAPETIPAPGKKMPGVSSRRVVVEIDPLPEPLPAPGKKMPVPVPVPSGASAPMKKMPIPARDPPAAPSAKEPTWSRADLGDELPLGRQKFGSGEFIREKVPFDEFAEAITVLDAIGPEAARDAVPVLRELLKTASSKHQHMISATLQRLERRPADAEPDSKQPAAVPMPPAEKDAEAPKPTRPIYVPAPPPDKNAKAPEPSTRPTGLPAPLPVPANGTFRAPAQWSDWGYLRRAGFEKDGQTVYVLEDSKKQPLVYAIENPNSPPKLEKLTGRRVCLYGPTQFRSDEFPRIQYLVVTHFATENSTPDSKQPATRPMPPEKDSPDADSPDSTRLVPAVSPAPKVPPGWRSVEMTRKDEYRRFGQDVTEHEWWRARYK